ncbi:hypothetical protein [Idiomarina sp.]|uniref:hypothetical protein n=1 Tax=Idiomarina sp. TaxID=1874361 RepID=UPI0026129D0E|nr:hypothetical protein [Idiomarina sp.]
MRLCVIGNSHVGALKDAVGVIEGLTKVSSVTFFAKAQQGMRELLVDKESDALVAGSETLQKSLILTSGGQSEIRVSDFDCFLLYGLDFNAYFKPNRIISSQLEESQRIDWFTTTTMNYVLSLLRLLTNKKIFLGHTPMVASGSQSSGEGEIDSSYLSNLELIESDILKRYHSVSVVGQPLTTICQGRKTKSDYSRGSIRMETGHKLDGTPHPEEDISHMNKVYGELWWKNFTTFVGCL